MERFETNSPEETRVLGKTLAEGFLSGTIIALSGDLGCGKTALVKGIMDFFGDGEQVTSPTFALVNEYDGVLPVYHFDVYRLEHPSLEDCQWMDEYLFGDGICLIEWADNIREILPQETRWITLKKDPARGEDFREIIVC